LAKPFAKPLPGRSIRQLSITLLLFVGFWIAMMATLQISYWITLLLALPTAAFVVRLFIIQHDCGHRSYFRSPKLNDRLGQLLGIITLTPHSYWREAHNIHHATCGNLEQRGIGDIWLVTVDEYRKLPWRKRLAYRIYRNPFVLFIIGPIYVFGLKFRLPLDLVRRRPKLLWNVAATNFGITGIVVSLGLGFGFLDLLLVQGPIIVLSATAGVWLFYVQHQFEETYWRKSVNWQFHDAALLSSSYYALPQPLRWLSADIGIHHIHHLSSGVPNYRLKECLDSMPVLKGVNRLGLIDTFQCLRLAIWDEASQRMVPFRAIRKNP
jgi:omega-6 fatty acid desaturase (delta-12 desaturase)